MADIEIVFGGPLLDGSAAGIVSDLLDACQHAVARQAFADVHTILNQDIQKPTPYYETQIITQRRGDEDVVHDRGIVYGPWLEGTGSRNRVTRFKGYRAFQRATESTTAKADRVIAPVAARFIQRLGG